MTANPSPIPPFGGETFLFASDNGPNISWLRHALQRRGTVTAVACSTQALDERIAALTPQAVFLDFSGAQASATAAVHRELKRDWPALPILATGSSAEPTTLLSALRAGVDDFVDMSAPAQALDETLDDLLQRRTATLASTRGRSIALLGARAGLGVTTLATHLALLLQDTLARSAEPGVALRRGVALLDLGLPARDGLLYLDTTSDFSFVDGMHNLRRLDQTLIQTALTRHGGGAAVLPLPANPAQMREIAQADPVALIRRMADFFDYQVADLGGFPSVDFIAQAVREADKTWVVCDQSIGAMVSTANLLRELHSRGLEPQRFSLVVNMFDPAAGIAARDIAGRLRLPLAHVLPMRRTALLAAAGRGEMLARTARTDPYVVAVQGLVRCLQREYAVPGAPVPSDSPWATFIAPLTGRWKTARES